MIPEESVDKYPYQFCVLIAKLTPCEIKYAKHTAEKLSIISQQSSLLPVTRMNIGSCI